MTDRSATSTYRGTGLTTGGWAAQQEAAEAGNAQPEADDMAGTEDGSVRLEGEEGQTGGFGNRPGDAVPNLNVTRVSNPARTRGLPAGLQTSPLGRSR